MTASLNLQPPDYAGRGLVNLAAELEKRLGGTPLSPALASDLSTLMPSASGYVLVLFDGLGDHQLDHINALTLRDSRRGNLDAPFPTTTTVSLATIATGLAPSRHGLLGYQLHLPEADVVANTIKWTTLWGDGFAYDYGSLLPRNLWERLSDVDIESVMIQPANFSRSPLSQVLYRGARFEGVESTSDWVDACLDLAQPGRLVIAYLPHVDVAAHMTGQQSAEYREAISLVSGLWEQLRQRLRGDVGLVGTSDHGHVDIAPERQIKLRPQDQEGRILYGDARAMFIKGPPPDGDLPASFVPFSDAADWWGPGPAVHPDRFPDGILVADPGHAILHRFADTRMIGHHGGLTDDERLVPLLVR